MAPSLENGVRGLLLGRRGESERMSGKGRKIQSRFEITVRFGGHQPAAAAATAHSRDSF